MVRTKLGADGQELESAIQQGYVDACLQLGPGFIPSYLDEKGKAHPMVLQFLLGSKNGGRVYVTKGIPDTLTIYRKGGGFGLLWIEFKRHNGKLSPIQSVMIEMLKACGQDVVVCYSTKEAVDTLLDRLGLVNQRRT